MKRRALRPRARIFLALFLLLALLGIIHLVYAPPPTPPTQAYSNANLVSKNYFLNASAIGPNPFPFCPSFGAGDVLGETYGPVTLSKSRLNLGSGARIQRLLQKALAGQPVTISVIGGSVSACHGSGDDPISPKCYPSKLFQWWNTIFPNPASELTNGAMRRTNSGYYGFCSAHHLPDQTDLVILELDTDDPPDSSTVDSFELLVRSILLRPDSPAILVLGHFSPQVHAASAQSFNGPDFWHTTVAQFYDIPHISIKHALLPSYLEDPALINKYYIDPVLANPSGHDLLVDMLKAYFQSQICVAWENVRALSSPPPDSSTSADGTPASPNNEGPGLFGGVGLRKGVPEPNGKAAGAPAAKNPGAQPAPNAGAHNLLSQANLFKIPPGRLNSTPRPGGKPYEEIAPFCVSANDLINPLPPSLFYGSGWSAYHVPKDAGEVRASSHYWFSTLPTSKLRIPIQIGAGDVGVYYLKEPIVSGEEGSSVECWVDDNYAGAKLIEGSGDVSEPVPT